MNDIDKQYFNAARASNRRLNELAIKQNCAAMRGLPMWSSEVAATVSQAIIAAKGVNLTGGQVEKLKQHRLTLPLKRLKLRSPPLWRKTAVHTGVDPCRGAADTTWEPPKDWHKASFEMMCPRCNGARNLGNGTLRNRNGFAYLTCNGCHGRTRSVRWKCS